MTAAPPSAPVDPDRNETQQIVSETYETRSVKETISETGALSAVFISGILFLIFIGSNNDIDTSLTWAAGAGELLYGHVGWVLSIYITALLAFYAVSIGGQILGGPDEAARTRRVLGFVAELMAVATITLMTFIAFYCWQHPAMSAILIILLPVVGVLLFLALKLGNFLVLDWDTKIAIAEKAQDQVDKRLLGVRLRSRRSFTLVWVLSSVVIAFGALLVTLPVIPLNSAFFLWLVYVALVALLLGVNAITMTTFFTSRDAQTRAFIWVLPALAYAILTGIAVTLILRDDDSPLLRMGWAFIVMIIATLATTHWPRSHAPRWILDWSMHGAAARLAEKSLTKQQTKAAREYLALRALRPVPPVSPTLLRRLRDALLLPAPEG